MNIMVNKECKAVKKYDVENGAIQIKLLYIHSTELTIWHWN